MDLAYKYNNSRPAGGVLPRHELARSGFREDTNKSCLFTKVSLGREKPGYKSVKWNSWRRLGYLLFHKDVACCRRRRWEQSICTYKFEAIINLAHSSHSSL